MTSMWLTRGTRSGLPYLWTRRGSTPKARYAHIVVDEIGHVNLHGLSRLMQQHSSCLPGSIIVRKYTSSALAARFDFR